MRTVAEDGCAEEVIHDRLLNLLAFGLDMSEKRSLRIFSVLRYEDLGFADGSFIQKQLVNLARGNTLFEATAR